MGNYKKTALKSNFMKFPANAIAVGNVGPNKGKLIGACGMFSKIMIMDPDTGEILRTYAQPDYPVHVSDDVSEAPDGTIYWSNLDVGTIGWCKPDNTSGEIEGTGFVNPICVTRDMKWLWYASCIGKDELWRVKLGPDGVPAEGAEHELMETGGGWSNSMDACDDGYIYSPTNMYGEVRRIHPDSGEIETVWEGLEFPSAIDVSDKTGIIYSTEFHLGNIVRIDLKRGTSRVLGKFPPMTDNSAVSDDSDNPRIFGSSFVADQIMEISERGDNPRIVSQGGIHFSAISCIGNRVLIKDMGRLQEYFPREREFKAVCWGNFQSYLLGKSHDWGVSYDHERINWLKSAEDMCNVTLGQIARPSPDGKSMLIVGDLMAGFPANLNVYDLKTREVTFGMMDLPSCEDAVMFGDDFYLICAKIAKELRGPEIRGPKSTYIANPKPSMEGLLTEEKEIVRVGRNGERKSLFQSAGLTAFAQKDGNVFASENLKGIIYQVAKDDKWLDKPVVIAKGLKNPEGICVGIDGNLLVLEANEDEQDGHNGRLVSIDVKTGKSTLICEGLGLTKKLNPSFFKMLSPHATVAQADDGTIYMYECGYMIFSMLEPRA